MLHEIGPVSIESLSPGWRANRSHKVFVIMEDALAQYAIGTPDLGGDLFKAPLIDIGISEQGIIFRGEAALLLGFKKPALQRAKADVTRTSIKRRSNFPPSLALRSHLDDTIVKIYRPPRSLINLVHAAPAGSDGF